MSMEHFDVVHTGLSQTQVIELGFVDSVGKLSDDEIRAIARAYEPEVLDSDVVVRSPSTGTVFIIMLEHDA